MFKVSLLPKLRPFSILPCLAFSTRLTISSPSWWWASAGLHQWEAGQEIRWQEEVDFECLCYVPSLLWWCVPGPTDAFMATALEVLPPWPQLSLWCTLSALAPSAFPLRLGLLLPYSILLIFKISSQTFISSPFIHISHLKYMGWILFHAWTMTLMLIRKFNWRKRHFYSRSLKRLSHTHKNHPSKSMEIFLLPWDT